MKTTHIGSLPFQSLSEARDFNSKFSLPVLFTLPKLNENDFMLSQVFGSNNSIEFDDSLLKKPINLNYTQILESFDEFKFQIIGPVTLLKCIRDLPTSRVQDVLDWHYNNILSLLEKRYMRRCYFFLDEPMLFDANEKEFNILNSFLLRLSGAFKKLAIHSCSQFKFNLLDQKRLDGISFESQYLEDYRPLKHLDLFLGVVETQGLAMKPQIDLSHCENNIYLTPDCGLAFGDPKMVQSVPENLTKWGALASLN